MKFENLFTSSSALELARDLAERQYTMSPAQVIQRLVRFGAIGAASILVIVVAIVGIRSSLGNDANTREVLFFASFMGALVFVSAGGAALVTLWDGFMGQYLQRLALFESQFETDESRAEKKTHALAS